MSGVRFYEMLTEHTKASCDSQHINLLISSRADTPDRTAYLLGRSDQDPLPVMIEEAKRLEQAGAALLAIPCNTAHSFYDGICREISVPVINIIEETVAFCAFLGLKRIGILATEGTVASRSYERVCEPLGISCIPCTKEEQAVITHLIYGELKQGLPPSLDRFLSVADALTLRGCEALVLGCTELSLLKKHHLRDRRFIDSSEVLARAAIYRCGKEPVGFDEPLMRFCCREVSLPLSPTLH
ncbi:MAG: aspartate/glutamate racemase family protein [Clostridia bacterium]|nr:aspartate/glutamate racemase family protein [Clostridia bacterium]